MVVIAFSLVVQKFLPLRTFLLLSQAQAVGGSWDLRSKMTHPRPSEPVASEVRPSAPPDSSCPPHDEKTHPSWAHVTPLNLRTAPPGWDSCPPTVPMWKVRPREVKGLVQAAGGTSWMLLLILGQNLGPKSHSWQRSRLGWNCESHGPMPALPAAAG